MHSPGHVWTSSLQKGWASQGVTKCKALCWYCMRGGQPRGGTACPDPLSEHPGTPSPVPAQPRILAPVLLAAFFKLQLCYFILIHQISLLSSCLQAEAFSVLIPSLSSQFFSNSLGRKETKPKTSQGLWVFLSSWINTPYACQTSENTQSEQKLFPFHLIHMKANVSMT